MEQLKVFSVIRTYGYNLVLDIVVAKDEEEVYKLMLWNKTDNPVLDIRQLDITKPGCVLAGHLSDLP